MGAGVWEKPRQTGSEWSSQTPAVQGSLWDVFAQAYAGRENGTIWLYNAVGTE